VHVAEGGIVPGKQISFSEAEFASKRRVARRERFLADMERVIPWQSVLAIIEPHYPKGSATGRRSDWSACCGCT